MSCLNPCEVKSIEVKNIKKKKRTRRGGRKRKEQRMKYLQRLEAERMLSEIGTVKPQANITPTICNDNLKDDQYNESKVESIKKEILISDSNDPHLHDSSLKEEKYKNVNMKGNSCEETASTTNMSIASFQNQLVSLSESAKEQHDVNMTNPTVKEELMDISSVTCNNTNMDTNNIPSTHQIISGTVPDNSFSNGSSISSDNLKVNNTHQTEDPTGTDRQPLLPSPLSCGLRNVPHRTLTSSVSSVSEPFPVLKSSDNTKIDSSIDIKKKTYSPTISKDSLQNCVTEQPPKNIYEKYSLNLYCSASDKIFGQLVERELNKIPELEKLKRKQAIMDILCKPL